MVDGRHANVLPGESPTAREPSAIDTGDLVLPSNKAQRREPLRQAFDVLRQSLEEAEERDAQFRATARGLAHDLRNLLLAISASAELAMESLTEQRRELQRIVEIVQRATEVTAPLLARANERAEASVLMDPSSAVAACCGLLEPLCGREIALCTFLRAASPVGIEPLQFERVLVNLVLNARDAMPRGGAIVIATDDVVLSPGETSERLRIPAGAYVTIRVTDGGIGMSRETREHLFQPFFSTKRPGKGSGVGLSSVAAIVEACGGAVEVQTAPGLGSSFRVYLRSASDVGRKRGVVTRQASKAPCRVTDPICPPALDTVVDREGHLALGWVGPNVLWASFGGRLSKEIGAAFALRLERMLPGRSGVHVFVDASGIDSLEAVGRKMALRALVRAARSQTSVLALNGTGGGGPTPRVFLEDLTGLVRATANRAEFETELFEVAPMAHAVVEQRLRLSSRNDIEQRKNSACEGAASSANPWTLSART